MRRSIVLFFLLFVYSLSVFSRSDSIMDRQSNAYVSGELLVKYETLAIANPKGEQILSEYDAFIREFERTFDVEVHHSRPVFNTLVNRMVKDYLPEKELHMQTYERRMTRRGITHKKSSADFSRFNLSRSLILRFECVDLEDLMKSIEKKNDRLNGFTIVSVSPNYIIQTGFRPNDTHYDLQWSHQITQAEKAWDITTGDTSVIIAILDSGIDPEHEDLREKLVPGYDFVNMDQSLFEPWQLLPDEDYTEQDFNTKPHYRDIHGTHVAGIAAAKTNNIAGIAGVCPNCKLMSLRTHALYFTEDSVLNGWSDGATINDALYYATNNGVDIVNMSIGGAREIALDGVAYAHANNVVLVSSSMNENTSKHYYPAAFPEVISVASTDSTDKKAPYSNYGNWIDISAPGSEIFSTISADTVFAADLSADNVKIETFSVRNSLVTPDTGISAIGNWVGWGNEIDLTDSKQNWELEGRIAVALNLDDISVNEVASFTKSKGAVGLIMILNPDFTMVSLTGDSLQLPVSFISLEDGKALMQKLYKSEVILNLKVGGTYLRHYTNASGTSMASPYVAGTVGLILSKNPGLDNEKVKRILLNSADYIDDKNPEYEKLLGSGRVNPYKALVYMNITPEIPYNQKLKTELDTPLKLTSESLGVIDEDNLNPEDFEIIIDENTNYTIKSDTILPDTGYLGILEVPVRVSDGIDTSKTSIVKVFVGTEIEQDDEFVLSGLWEISGGENLNSAYIGMQTTIDNSGLHGYISKGNPATYGLMTGDHFLKEISKQDDLHYACDVLWRYSDYSTVDAPGVIQVKDKDEFWLRSSLQDITVDFYFSRLDSLYLTEGLAAYYSLDAHARDLSGNDNHGELSGVSSFSDRNNNLEGASYFDGINDKITVPHSASLDITDQISISAWIRHNTGFPKTFENILQKGNDSYGLQFQDGNFMFKLKTAQGYSLCNSEVRPLAGEWIHVVGVYDGAKQRIYVDGILKKTVDLTGKINSSSESLGIGRPDAPDNYYLSGVLDDIRIYSRALSEEEVSNLYIKEVDKVESVIDLYLFPGETHSGYYSYWKTKGSGISNIRIMTETETDWLSLETDLVQSSGCFEVKDVKHTFYAPREKGIYEAKVLFGSQEILTNNYTIRLHVTDNPPAADTAFFNFDPGKTYTATSNNTWGGLKDVGCKSVHFPGENAIFSRKVYPETPGFTIDPQVTTVLNNESYSFDYSFNFEQPGYYQVYEMRTNSWSFLPVYLLYNIQVGTSTSSVPEKAKPGMRLFPNPSNGIVKLEMNDVNSIRMIRVIHPEGRVVFQKSTLNPGINEIDLTDLPSGLFFMDVITEKGRYTEKLIIKK